MSGTYLIFGTTYDIELKFEATKYTGAQVHMQTNIHKKLYRFTTFTVWVTNFDLWRTDRTDNNIPKRERKTTIRNKGVTTEGQSENHSLLGSINSLYFSQQNKNSASLFSSIFKINILFMLVHHFYVCDNKRTHSCVNTGEKPNGMLSTTKSHTFFKNVLIFHRQQLNRQHKRTYLNTSIIFFLIYIFSQVIFSLQKH